MKKNLLITVCCIFLLSGIARADEFSLYGVSMGMPQTEIDTHWTKMDGDQYTIEGSILLNILPVFDHRDRLYKISFSVPVPLMDQYPGTYATTAFQEIVQQRWNHPDIIVSLRTGRGMADVSLTSRSLEREYADHVKTQMKANLSTILKP